jgi:methionyl-tRNA formyltransferase
MRLLVFADGFVGEKILGFLINNHLDDIGTVVVLSENKIYIDAFRANLEVVVFADEYQVIGELSGRKKYDLGLLLWWPKIISKELLSATRLGFINTHPSFLPHNRGKHYNFWAIVEQAPFGVSLHLVDEGIDRGDIVAQESIAYSWEDNGETLYYRAREAMYDLFVKSYPLIRTGDFFRIPQDLKKGSYHAGSEIDLASMIQLDHLYTARDLLNRLRARSFSGFQGCRFEDNGRTYEVRIQIERIDDGSV